MLTDKQEYQEKLEAKLQDVETQLEQWKAQAQLLEADAKVEYQRRLDDLEQQRKELNDKLNELKSSSTSAWQDIKDTIDNAWDDLKESMGNATARFR